MLPALHLYRHLLRAHRTVLAPAERVLGDSYIRQEFRLHKDVADRNVLDKFFKEWTDYLAVLEGKRMAEKVGPQLFEKLTDEQLGQLYELMRTIKEQEAAAEDAGNHGSEKK